MSLPRYAVWPGMHGMFHASHFLSDHLQQWPPHDQPGRSAGLELLRLGSSKCLADICTIGLSWAFFWALAAVSLSLGCAWG